MIHSYKKTLLKGKCAIFVHVKLELSSENNKIELNHEINSIIEMLINLLSIFLNMYLLRNGF